MTGDSVASWVDRYRASVEDTPTPVLDQIVLEAAARRSEAQRSTRRLREAYFVGAFVVLSAATAWQLRDRAADSSGATMDFGRHEVSTLRYLLDVGTYSDIGPRPIDGEP